MPEYGNTIEEIAKNKARQAFNKIKKPLIVDDTGIFFSAYNNFPGLIAKRLYIAIGFSGLLKLLKKKSRKAYFKAVICYYDGRKMKLFDGKLHGNIVKKIHPDRFKRKKFPYDQIFFASGSRKPVSSMTLKDKIKTSHRAKAVRKFARWYSK